MKNGRHWIVAIGAAFLVVAVSLGTTCLSFFVAPITKEFGYSRSKFTIYYSLINLVAMLTMPMIGRGIQKYGIRKVALVGGLWCTAGFFALSFCTSLISFYIVGALMGVFLMGCSIINAAVAVNTWFIAKRGTIMGAVMAASGLGAAIFSMILPTFIATPGWRKGYWLLSAAWFLCTVPVSLFLLKDKPQDIGLQPYGYDEASANSSKTKSPNAAGVPYTTALKTYQLWMLGLAGTLMASVAGLLQHLPAFFVGNGMTMLQVGSLMSILSLSMIGTKIVLGVVCDKLGLPRPLLGVIVLSVAAFLLIPLKSYTILALSMICMAFNFGSQSVLPPLFTGKIFGAKDYAKIYGIIGMAGSLGTAIGPPVWGRVYDVTKSYYTGLICAPIIIIIAGLIYAFALKTGGKLQTTQNTMVKAVAAR